MRGGEEFHRLVFRALQSNSQDSLHVIACRTRRGSDCQISKAVKSLRPLRWSSANAIPGVVSNHGCVHRTSEHGSIPCCSPRSSLGCRLRARLRDNQRIKVRHRSSARRYQIPPVSCYPALGRSTCPESEVGRRHAVLNAPVDPRGALTIPDHIEIFVITKFYGGLFQ